jgi:uroporphyrinogen decarboxylase
VLCAINLEEPDRVPLDIELSDEPYQALCRYYNIEDHLVSRLFTYNVKLSRVLNCDLLVFEAGSPIGWSPEILPDGTYLDEWGILRKFRMKGTIDWFEKHPIIGEEDLDNYRFPDPSKPGRLMDLERAIKNHHGEFAIFAGIGFALWERAWTLHGFQQSITDFYQNPDFMEKLLDRIVKFDEELAKIVVEYDIDAFRLGDDYGSQRGLLFSPEIWRHFIKPRLRKITNVALKKGIPVVLHTCGNVSDILVDLNEIGITILNPVQPKAMNPSELKQRYGNLFCFYGTLDLQQTLAFGKPVDVRNEVEERIRTVGVGGGLILAPAHTIPPGVPIENILAISESIRKMGRGAH